MGVNGIEWFYHEITNEKIMHVDTIYIYIYDYIYIYYQQYDIWVCPTFVLVHQHIQCKTERYAMIRMGITEGQLVKKS